MNIFHFYSNWFQKWEVALFGNKCDMDEVGHKLYLILIEGHKNIVVSGSSLDF